MRPGCQSTASENCSTMRARHSDPTGGCRRGCLRGSAARIRGDGCSGPYFFAAAGSPPPTWRGRRAGSPLTAETRVGPCDTKTQAAPRGNCNVCAPTSITLLASPLACTSENGQNTICSNLIFEHCSCPHRLRMCLFPGARHMFIAIGRSVLFIVRAILSFMLSREAVPALPLSSI